MKKLANLFARIRGTLSNSAVSPEEIAETLAAAQAAATADRAAAESARERALDPLIADPEAALTEANDAAFAADRAERAVSALEQRLEQRRLEVAEEARRSAYNSLKQRQDELTRRVREEYPGVAKTLISLIEEINEVNNLREVVNKDLPKDAPGLPPAEEVARGIGKTTSPYADSPAKIVEMVIPDPTDPMRPPLWRGSWRSSSYLPGSPTALRISEDDARYEWFKRKQEARVKALSTADRRDDSGTHRPESKPAPTKNIAPGPRQDRSLHGGDLDILGVARSITGES